MLLSLPLRLSVVRRPRENRGDAELMQEQGSPHARLLSVLLPVGPCILPNANELGSFCLTKFFGFPVLAEELRSALHSYRYSDMTQKRQGSLFRDIVHGLL